MFLFLHVELSDLRAKSVRRESKGVGLRLELDHMHAGFQVRPHGLRAEQDQRRRDLQGADQRY